MQPQFTPGASRALQLAGSLARRSNSPVVEPEHLLWALVLDESRGAEILSAHGLPRENLDLHLPLAAEDAARDLAREDDDPALGTALEAILLEARRQAALLGKQVEIGSEHLLCGLSAVSSPVQELLAAHGLGPAVAVRRSSEQAGDSTGPLAADIQLSFPSEAAGATDTLRILDAAANRAREGLRVVEDYVRFALDDRHLTRLLKNWRHRLAEILVSSVDSHALVASRDTTRDVGRTVRTRREGIRQTMLDVVIANFKRVEEAVRTLEEYGKVLSPETGRRLEALRYELYTIEKAVMLTHSARERLAGRELYVLVSSELCPHGSGPVIAAALAGGAGVIQVREKTMTDRELVTYAKLVREWTARAGALFIMNDRPDLALLTEADGVHVGQDELSVREARRIVGPAKLVGVSTHTLDQARQAVLDGADYIGVGPVFASGTKTFAQLAGLDLVRQVADEIALPAYAIGGISVENIDEVLAAGARGVAVSGAVCRADNPGQAARNLREKLETVRQAAIEERT